MCLQLSTAHLSTGPRLRYAAQGDADGEATVLLHGWPDSWFTWSRVLPLLSPRRRVLALDQRGFGDSDRPEHGYTIDHYAADVVALLDALSIERAALVGHSFGTFVARRTAIAHPSRVAALVLIGTGVTARCPVTLEVQAAIRDLADPVPREFAREFQAGTAYAPLPPEFFERVVDESLKLPARLWREVFDGLLAYQDDQALGRIRVPTLLLWGDHDALFAREDQDRLVAAIPRAGLRVYAETGHCPNWECPERVAADIDDFLRPISR
jgi:pimeloyl-ACP methyl ester carboxylesterase